MKKNILVLNYEFPPLGGGQANANYFLFKEFSKNKDYNFILITSSTDKYKEEKFSDNIKIYYLDIGKNNQNLHNQSIKDLLKYTFKSYKLSKQIIKKNKIDKIMAWSYPSIGLGYIFKKLYKIPYITLLRGSDVPFYEKKWKNLDRFIFRFLAPIFWKNSEKVIANSSGLKKLALKNSKNTEVLVIPNGVDIDFYKPDNNLKLKEKFIILGVGRLIERKGFDILIKSIGKIKNKENIELLLVGDGPEKENLKNLAEKSNVSLKLLGLKNKDELQKIYRQANIFCLPSKNEGMSNTVLEAISSGLPIVTTNVGGMQELVEELKNGFILEVGNITGFTEKIEYFLQDRKKEIEFGEYSRKKAESMSWEKVAKSFLEYLF